MRRRYEKTEALVLRLVDYSESDRIVGLLTPGHGRISAFAPGARKSQKRFGGGLDLFALLIAELKPPSKSQSHLWRLSSIELLDPHFGLRTDLRRLAAAGYVTECIWALSGDGDPQPRLFSWWKETLKSLAESSVSEETNIRLALRFLELFGYAPQWTACVECGRPGREERLFFSFPRGGVTCVSCRQPGEGRFVEPSLARALSLGSLLRPEDLRQAQETLDSFVAYTLGRMPASQRFREEVFHHDHG